MRLRRAPVSRTLLVILALVVFVALVSELLLVRDARQKEEAREAAQEAQRARARATVCALAGLLERELGPAPEIEQFRSAYGCQESS